MSSIRTGNSVFTAFIANANAEYRAAGLSEYQMRVKRDGTVDIPKHPGTARALAAPASPASEAMPDGAAPTSGAPTGATQGAAAGAAATQQQSGAAPAQGSSTAQQPTAQAAPTAAGPSVTVARTEGADGVHLAWEAVPGATRYGVYQEGKLIGTVTNPKFGLRLAADAISVIEIDAELPNGQRTKRSNAVAMRREGSGAVQAKALAPGALEAMAAQQAQQKQQQGAAATPAAAG